MKSIILTIIPLLAVSALANGSDIPKLEPFHGEDFSLNMESAVKSVGDASAMPAGAAPEPEPATPAVLNDFTVGQLDCETRPNGIRVFSRMLTDKSGSFRQIVRVIIPRGIKI